MLLKLGFLAAVISLVVAGLLSAAPGPAGYWRTIDDKTGKPRGTVLIYEQQGVFYGKIVSTVNPAESKARCMRCGGERRGRPVLGMVILRNMRAAGEAGAYDGGDILDPDTGKIYRCKMLLSTDGKKLMVRGYIGVSLLGRTQTWWRDH